MRVVGLANYVEPFLHRTFGSVGVLTARAPYLTISAVVVFLLAMCGGNWKIETELSANELLIARRGRIAGEKEFYVDNFDLISPVLSSVIVTPKRGVDILSVEALDEVHALQESIRTFSFEYRGLNVSLEQFCFKAINADPAEPCWQSSLLESFREGDVFNVGGELNTNYGVLFAPRPSYKQFNFTRDLKRSFLAQTNLNPDSLMLGKFEVDETDQDTITSVGALQILFGAKAPKVLQQDGLQYFEWTEREVEEAGGAFCPDVTTCEACADAVQPTQFAAAGCTFDGASSQSDSCCASLESVRNSPCIEVVFERRAEIGPVANPLFTACGLSIVEISPRCNNQARIVGTRSASGPPDVCICLAGASDECTTAAGSFLAENPQYTEAFTNAGSGEEEDVAELARVLVEEIGCPTEDTPNPLCSCLVDATGETCTTALGTFLESNPDQAELFSTAATGDAEAAQAVAQFLVTEFGCELPEPAPASPPVDAQQQAETAAPATLYDAQVTVIRDETDTIGKARRLMHAWEKAWRGQVGDVAKEYEFIDVVWITASSIDDEVEVATEADAPLLVFGYILILTYILVYVTFDWKLSGVRLAFYPPGPTIAALSFLVVLLSVAAAMGVAGYVSAVSSFKVSFSTIQMIPLLMLGLGINDFFVLCSALKSVLLSPSCPGTHSEIMYEAIAVGGTSITLSSAANAAAFSLGTLSAVPIVLWFSVQMAVGIVIAYIVSITAVPCLLSLAVRRHLSGRPDPLLSLLGVKSIPSPETNLELTQGKNEAAVSGIIRRFRWPITFSVFSIFAVWMALGVRYMVHFEQGVDLSESVRENTDSYDYLKTTEEYFNTNQINIVFRDTVDYANAADFQSVRQSEFEYVNEGHRVEKQLMTRSWMEFYTQYVEGKFCSNEICMNEVNWYYDGFSSVDFAHPSKNICSEAETAGECREMCETHCPQGPQGSEFRCQYEQGTMNCFCPYRPMLKSRFFYENPDGFNSRIVSYWADFLANTTTGRASRVFVNLDDTTTTEKNPLGLPKASRAYVYARGLQDVPKQLDHIESGRDILDRQDVDVYPFDFVVYAVGEQYEDLPLRTVEAVGISMAIATVVMLPLIVNFFTAVIVSVSVLLAVLLAVGSSSWTVINLDYAAYVAFISAVGLAVEFCAHIARAFMLATGDRLTRTLSALRTMGIAVLNGGITTFLGILPSALSDLPPVRDRLFVQFSIIVLAGLFIGLLFLPTVLSLIGPPSFNKEGQNAEEEKAKEKEEKVDDP